MKVVKKELQILIHKDIFEYILISITDSNLLPLKWIPKYKFDIDGFLDLFKIKLYIKDDL
jgi:hypothetical protein